MKHRSWNKEEFIEPETQSFVQYQDSHSHHYMENLHFTQTFLNNSYLRHYVIYFIKSKLFSKMRIIEKFYRADLVLKVRQLVSLVSNQG